MRRALVLIGLLLLLSWPALAQSVSFDVQANPPVVGVGGQVIVTASLSGDLDAYPEPVLKPHKGFDIYKQGVTSNIQIVNGQMSSVTSVNWVLIAREAGTHVLEPLEVNVGGKLFWSNAVTITVTPHAASTPPPSGGPPVIPNNPAPPGGWQPPPPPPASRRVFVEADAEPKNPFVNQRVDYMFKFFHAARLNGNPSYEPPSATGSLRAEMPQHNTMEERDGQTYAVSEVKTAFFPTAPGPFTIGETRLVCQLDNFDPLSLQPDDFSAFLSTGNTRELKTEELALDVRPLPSTGRPDDFAGAVGNFEFSARLDKDSTRTGETVHLILTVTGDGHPDLVGDPKLPPLPGFKVFPMKSHTELDKASPTFRGTATFTVPLVPTETGNLNIHGLRFSYFDPHEERYQTIEAPPLSIQVARGKAQPKPTPASSVDPDASPVAAPAGLDQSLGVHPVHQTAALNGPVTWHRHPLFWAVQALPLSVLLAFLGARSFKSHRERTSGDHRRSSAGRRARKALKTAEDYGQLYRIVHAYLEDRLGQSFTGVSLSELNARLAAAGLGEGPRQQLCELLETAEMASYAPAGTTDPKAYNDHVRVASRVLDALEGALR